MPPLIDALKARQPRVPATLVLIALNGLVFVAMMLAGAPFGYAANEVQLGWGANFAPATQDGQYWRLGSAMFLHFGIMHLGLNMFALWDGGAFLERMLGSWRFLALYLLSGLAGNLLSLVVQGNQAVSGGASGAIFGVYGALLWSLWQQRQSLDQREFRWLFGGGGLFTLLSLISGLFIRGIDNSAHGGGLLSGLLLACLWMPPAGRPWLRPLALAAWTGLVALNLYNLPQPRFLWHEELAARHTIEEFFSQDAMIHAELSTYLAKGPLNRAESAELAKRLETQIAAGYRSSFEGLARASGKTELPSSSLAKELQPYAALRLQASESFAEGIRTHNTKELERAFALEQEAAALRVPKPRRQAKK